MPKSACLFCNGANGSKLTNEHVNPQWLLEHLQLPKSDQLFQGVAATATGMLTQSPRIHSTHAFVQGNVCDGCNSGWMSELETAAKPILVDLMDGHRLLGSLTKVEAKVLSRWSAKTAYLHSWTSPLKRPVGVEYLQALNGEHGNLANGVYVFAKQADFIKPTSYVQTWFWPQVGKAVTKENGESPDDAIKLGLQIRRLYLLVAHWPSNVGELMLLKDEHFPLHPGELKEWWTYEIGELPVGGGEVDQLLAFCNTLAVRNLS